MSDELRRELERWGFSDTEIDVYLAIVEMGEGVASEVADRAGVSGRHVYRIAGRLEERGFVDLDDHVSPTRLRARSPEAVDAVVERSRATLVDGLESLYAAAPDSPADVELIKRQPTVLDRARDLLSEAEEWIVFAAPADAAAEVASELSAAVDRGVLVQLLTDDVRGIGQFALSDLGTIVRTCPVLDEFLEFALVVDTYTTLVVSPTASEGDDQRFSPGLYLTDETLTPRVLSSLQGNEWRLGEQRVAPSPADLPLSTTTYQRAVVQATVHRNAGTDLVATVDGHRVGDGESASVSGRVADVRQGFVEPYGKTFLYEEALVLETEDGRVTVGDPAASIEDYAAHRVTLEEV